MCKITMEQAIIITGYTGHLLCPFSNFHSEVEKRIGHPVFTHQFGDKEFVENKVKPLFENDFMKILPLEEK